MPTTSPAERHPKLQQPLVLLGQQRESPRLQKFIERCGLSGPVALVSAGWEEDEEDDQWVRDAVDVPVVNSRLYSLADDLFQLDPEVLQLLRERQDRLRALREVNELQLEHLGTVARELWQRLERNAAAVAPWHQTLAQIQDVDTRYLKAVSGVIKEYDRRIAPQQRRSVLDYRRAVLERLRGCQALLIAGGHVGVLLNRLNLCRLLKHLPLPIIAWAGGAMALGERVYFYDHFIPHAQREVELSRQGMALYRGLQLFPRAAERLNLADPCELAILAQRLPNRCLLLDQHSEIMWSANGDLSVAHVRMIDAQGEILEWTP